MKRVGNTLTAEERDVLILSARRLTNEEIAERLGMSVIKVKTLIHRASIKLGAHTRHATIHFAIMQGDIKLDEVHSPDELAEYLPGFTPDVLSKIAWVVRLGDARGMLLMIDKDSLHIDKKRDTILTGDTILTRGERDILIFVGLGLTNKEIAEKLFLSVSRVRNVLNKACYKLGAHSRGDAFVLALKKRDIEISEVLSRGVILRCLAGLKPESLEKIARLLDKKPQQERIQIAGY